MAPVVVNRLDYRPPAHLVSDVDLSFDLHDEKTTVKSKLSIRQNPANPGNSTLWLDGERLALKSIKVNGAALAEGDYTVTDKGLSIPNLPDPATVEIENEINPKGNTRLQGLYMSNGIFTTHCEAQGFRNITYYPDRPDVMARFTVRVEADALLPTLLSNGNPGVRGVLPNGRHYASFTDPIPKSSYLFALVAGRLDRLTDSFTTMTGKTVKLGVHVEPGKTSQAVFALEALKRAMKWDEDVFGREYDLDVFNIVAVPDFNSGAMENKGLNIFNAKFVLANPETGTDGDYEHVDSVIAHEYFHNWSGDRVTVRDWFQLSLKEGFTVFRDQEYSSDTGSRAVQRIGDVAALRRTQFAEDAGPLAHPIRPDSYIEIRNFYTTTVYEKGAEVVRMLKTLLGPAEFRKGTDHYFSKNDGKAVECDDFVKSIAEATGRNLDQFMLWYSQAGTPTVEAEGKYDPRAQTYSLTLRQTVPPTPGQPVKQLMHIPVAMGLLGKDGKDLPLQLAGEAAPAGTSRVLELTGAEQTFVFTNVPAPPVPSLLRGFSAPVKLVQPLSDDQLRFLMKHDSDAFNRWEAGQTIALRTALRLVADKQAGRPLKLDRDFVGGFKSILTDATLDDALKAKALVLPPEDVIAQAMKTIDVDAIHDVREFMRGAIATALKGEFKSTYAALAPKGAYSHSGAEAGRRSLRNLTLGYLIKADAKAGIALAETQYKTADNLTDRMAGFVQLLESAGPARDAAVDSFYQRYKTEQVVIDKWFTAQSMAGAPDNFDRVKALLQHPDFTWKNPNRMRSVVMAFSGNMHQFHRADGEGYKLLADAVLTVDKLNPQVASRLMGPLRNWRQFDAARGTLMQAQLERLVNTTGISPHVFEIASKSLAPAVPPANDPKNPKP